MKQEMLDSSQIRMAFYQGSDGPRVMLFGPRDAAFELFKQCVCQLAECGNTDAIELHRKPWVYASGGVTLRLTLINSECDSRRQRILPGIRRTCISPPSFEWRQTNQGWGELVELVQELIDADSDCHQYLTSYPTEEAIVVLSKGEYDDSVLEL